MSDSLRAFMASLTSWLDAAAVPYMVAGSFASTLHGRPRSTQDVDIVIDPTDATLRAFLAGVATEHVYVDALTARAALLSRDMFNLIDMDSGWKADLIVRKARPFSVAEFERRMRADWLGLSVFVATPEDVIVSKLEWCQKSGGSQRQLDDVAGVVAAVGPQLDRTYIETWVEALRLEDEWRALNAHG